VLGVWNYRSLPHESRCFAQNLSLVFSHTGTIFAQKRLLHLSCVNVEQREVSVCTSNTIYGSVHRWCCWDESRVRGSGAYSCHFYVVVIWWHTSHDSYIDVTLQNDDRHVVADLHRLQMDLWIWTFIIPSIWCCVVINVSSSITIPPTVVVMFHCPRSSLIIMNNITVIGQRPTHYLHVEIVTYSLYILAVFILRPPFPCIQPVDQSWWYSTGDADDTKNGMRTHVKKEIPP